MIFKNMEVNQGHSVYDIEKIRGLLGLAGWILVGWIKLKKGSCGAFLRSGLVSR